MQGMRIGAMAAEGTGDPPVPGMSGPPGLDEIVENAQRFEALGLDTAWIANIEIDAATDLVAFIYDTDGHSRTRTEVLLGELSGSA